MSFLSIFCSELKLTFSILLNVFVEMNCHKFAYFPVMYAIIIKETLINSSAH